jgi:hypothetical protein
LVGGETGFSAVLEVEEAEEDEELLALEDDEAEDDEEDVTFDEELEEALDSVTAEEEDEDEDEAVLEAVEDDDEALGVESSSQLSLLGTVTVGLVLSVFLSASLSSSSSS